MSDPWKHRSEGMRCKTCMWFCPKTTKVKNGLDCRDTGHESIPKQMYIDVINLGRCRKRAPTMNGYPVVFVNDWCGDHKLNENAVISEQLSVSAEVR